MSPTGKFYWRGPPQIGTNRTRQVHRPRPAGGALNSFHRASTKAIDSGVTASFGAGVQGLGKNLLQGDFIRSRQDRNPGPAKSLAL